MSPLQKEIESLVRQVVSRTLGENRRSGQRNVPTQRQVVDGDMVQQMPVNSVQIIPLNSLITPLARQIAMERRIKLETGTHFSPPKIPFPQSNHQLPVDNSKPVVALGTDHGGYHLKEQIRAMLETAESGYAIIDCGTYSTDAVDYPDYAYAVAELVANGRAWRGIIVDGAGIGSCMAANKVPGVRAAMCYDQATAVNSREHNNANVLTLGAGLIGPNLAKQIINTWLKTEFGGGRHARRVDKIDQIEKRFLKG